MTTRKPHALDPAALSLETLAKSGMLGRFPGAVESFDDYQDTPGARWHVCNVERPLGTMGNVSA